RDRDMNLAQSISTITNASKKLMEMVETVAGLLKRREDRDRLIQILRKGEGFEHPPDAEILEDKILRGEPFTYADLCTNIAVMILAKKSMTMTLDAILAKENPTPEEEERARGEIHYTLGVLNSLMKSFYFVLYQLNSKEFTKMDNEIHSMMAETRAAMIALR